MKKIFALLLTAVMLFTALILPAQAGEDKLNYVVLGDSIAWGSGVYNSEKACYGRLVADTNGYDYVNYGVNGFRTMDLIDLLDEEQTAADVAGADIISLSIGGNDYLQQNLPKIFVQVMGGNYKIVNDIEEIFRENFAVIMDRIKELNPDVTLLVQTLYNPRMDLLRDFYGIAVERINRSIYAYLEENPGAFEVVDVNAVFTPDHPEYIALDTIHPSAVGNEKIAELVLAELCRLGLGENTVPTVQNPGIDQIPFMSRVLKFFRDLIDRVLSVFA